MLAPALGAALALLGACGVGAGVTPSADADPPAPTEPPVATSQAAAAQLAALAVKGRAPMTGYDRDRFGQPWLDADRNGCDTRNDVLAAQLTAVEFAPGTRDCVVGTASLDDPFTGAGIEFVYGDGALVDIDHVVALGNAWATGASAWDVRMRAALANDPMNLLAVDASANRQKGDGDAATWLPANKAYRCAYVARQVAVKTKYGLWATPAESTAIARVLASCPDQAPVPDSGAPVRVDQDITDPGVPGTGYENCDAARAAGAAPVRRGDAGYGPHLDGDGDGISCE